MYPIDIPPSIVIQFLLQLLYCACMKVCYFVSCLYLAQLMLIQVCF